VSRLAISALLATFLFPIPACAQVRTFTATHTYILSDHDSKDDARQRCLLEAKRKVLEQAGVYVESASEVKDFQLTKDKISSFAAAVMQVRDTKETFGFENGHNTLTLTITADVDLTAMHKQLAARQVDKRVRDEVATQKEHLQNLNEQVQQLRREPIQFEVRVLPLDMPKLTLPRKSDEEEYPDLFTLTRQQQPLPMVKPGETALFAFTIRGPSFESPFRKDQIVDSRERWEELLKKEDAWMTISTTRMYYLGYIYANGWDVPQDYTTARKWWEMAAKRRDPDAQFVLGELYAYGLGVPQNPNKALEWWKMASESNVYPYEARTRIGLAYAYGWGVHQDYANARKLWEEGADWDSTDAQYNLGILYAKGWGVPQNAAKARKWMEKAAGRGHKFAKYQLAEQQPSETIWLLP
jgi:hypothetical protein